jgi:hypothetical protein
MARAVCSSAPLSGAASFLRARRQGRGLVHHATAISRGRFPGNFFRAGVPALCHHGRSSYQPDPRTSAWMMVMYVDVMAVDMDETKKNKKRDCGKWHLAL